MGYISFRRIRSYARLDLRNLANLASAWLSKPLCLQYTRGEDLARLTGNFNQFHAEAEHGRSQRIP